MREQVRAWVERIVAEYKPKGPVLEVGALNINGTIRDLFPQEGYVGLDKRAGPGVDLVADICDGEFFQQFRTVVCCETLEHIARPWEAIEEMHSTLRPGGLFIGTWCFVYAIHNEPEDYWRATPAPRGRGLLRHQDRD
ncbi:MAG: class I SAM-dependent methyltransferase [Dehalococcoidia bacterium]|nr:class I SAM-dependent methyltransferase [Dehalococcoidia bacterium]